MSIINSILGRPDATIQASANTAYTPFPTLSGQPTDNIPAGPAPGTLGTDSYQPVAYTVPTNVPAAIPAAVTAWRGQETMVPEIRTRQVASFKEVPVDVPAPRVRAPRAPKAAPVAEGVEGAAAESAATETASTTARTASRTASRAKVASTASEASAVETQAGAELAETTQATKQVRTMKTKVEATPKLTSAGLWGAVKTSALVSGGISLALNGYAMLKGQETFAEGGSNIVGDVAAGAVGGVGGAVASSFAVPMIASAFGIAGGFPLTALTFGVGMAGYWLADKLFRKTSFFQSLKQDIFNLLSGHPGAVRNPAQMPAYAPAANTLPTTQIPVATSAVMP